LSCEMQQLMEFESLLIDDLNCSNFVELVDDRNSHLWFIQYLCH
jgi:hypothetical protein